MTRNLQSVSIVKIVYTISDEEFLQLINSSSIKDLQSLQTVGAKRAKLIYEWRETYGNFSDVSLYSLCLMFFRGRHLWEPFPILQLRYSEILIIRTLIIQNTWFFEKQLLQAPIWWIKMHIFSHSVIPSFIYFRQNYQISWISNNWGSTL